MSGSNSAISRRRLLKGAGAMWLLSVSQVGLAAMSQVVAVRVWPASSYTRVTVESNRLLKYKQFALSNPERVVVDIEGVNLNSVLKGMGAQIRPDDPYIKSARVGQFDPQTVRMVFELKQNVKPQLFALAPVAGFKERLVMDLYPANAQDVQDPLLALLEEYNKGDLDKQVPPAQSGPQPGKAGRDRPIVIMLDPGHGGEDSGAVGKYKTREKDVVLQIARRLRALIEKEGNMKVFMTRNEDIFIPLKVPRGESAEAACRPVCLYSRRCIYQSTAQRFVGICALHQRGDQHRREISGANSERLGFDWRRQQERRSLRRPYHVRHGAIADHRRQPEVW